MVTVRLLEVVWLPDRGRFVCRDEVLMHEKDGLRSGRMDSATESSARRGYARMVTR